MKQPITLSFLAFLLIISAAPCFALWDIAEVSKADAKAMGIEIRSTPAGPKDLRIEVEIKTDGKLKNFGRVDLRVGEEGKVVVAALKEDRSKPGRVLVGFNAARSQLQTINLWIMVPGAEGGVAYEVRVKAFVEANDPG
jgi:hypothetical protein